MERRRLRARSANINGDALPRRGPKMARSCVPEREASPLLPGTAVVRKSTRPARKRRRSCTRAVQKAILEDGAEVITMGCSGVF